MALGATNGFGGSVVSNLITYCIENWSVDASCDVLDITSTCDGGYQNNIAGTKKAMVTIKTFYDGTVDTFGGFTIGALVICKLQVGSSGDFWTIPIRIASYKMENPVKGVCTVDISGESSGSFSFTS